MTTLQDQIAAWLARPVWMQRAACRGAGPEIFYPERGQSTGEAKAVCAGCPVRFDCIDYAMVTSEPVGVWGGLTERERRQLRRRVFGPRSSTIEGLPAPGPAELVDTIDNEETCIVSA